VCGCTPETDAAFCTHYGAQCGAKSGVDNCGQNRTVSSCGTCAGTGETCGGGAQPAANVCGCTTETDAQFCARLGAECGQKSGTDNCGQSRTVTSCGTCANGGTCSAQGSCPWVASTGELGARTAGMTGDGLSNCGPNGDDNCARSLLVPGGTFYRGTDTSYPATVSSFRLDKYEVTVGRFRKFVDAWLAGWRPQTGSGKHTHVNGSSGLVSVAGGNETGWDMSWTAYVGAPAIDAVIPALPAAATKAEWDANLSCGGNWTAIVGTNETRPADCFNWFDAYAFCIWDGGFLASEAEWEYAARGGSQQRIYPWGSSSPTPFLAVYGRSSTANVGSVPGGNGTWGHSDLAGNLWEWNLDWEQPSFSSSCVDCTELGDSTALRQHRGGAFSDGISFLLAAGRRSSPPARRDNHLGSRCARSP
jgi:formylglycine-generating enzyme required for sulfatase activity